MQTVIGPSSTYTPSFTELCLTLAWSASPTHQVCCRPLFSPLSFVFSSLSVSPWLFSFRGFSSFLAFSSTCRGWTVFLSHTHTHRNSGNGKGVEVKGVRRPGQSRPDQTRPGPSIPCHIDGITTTKVAQSQHRHVSCRGERQYHIALIARFG